MVVLAGTKPSSTGSVVVVLTRFVVVAERALKWRLGSVDPETDCATIICCYHLIGKDKLFISGIYFQI